MLSKKKLKRIASLILLLEKAAGQIRWSETQHASALDLLPTLFWVCDAAIRTKLRRHSIDLVRDLQANILDVAAALEQGAGLGSLSKQVELTLRFGNTGPLTFVHFQVAEMPDRGLRSFANES